MPLHLVDSAYQEAIQYSVFLRFNINQDPFCCHFTELLHWYISVCPNTNILPTEFLPEYVHFVCPKKFCSLPFLNVNSSPTFVARLAIR